MRITTYLAGGAIAFLAMATHGLALDADIYLSVRTPAPVVERVDSALGLQADASATVQSSEEQNEENASSSMYISKEVASTSSTGFLERLYAWLLSLGLSLDSQDSDRGEEEQDARATNVSTHSTVIVLPKAMNSAVVYYSTTSPVTVASTTAHASPWRFWRKNEVAIHGLMPNTMYFYKIVDLGTTTAEASFRTRAQ